MNLYFTYESGDTLKSFSLFLTVKIISNILKFSRRRSRPPDDAEFGHFT